MSGEEAVEQPLEENQQFPQQPEETEAQESSEELESDSARNAASEAIEQIEADQKTEDDEEPPEEEEAEQTEEEKQQEEERKKWKLKVDGKEIEIDDEQELIKRAQMGYAADQKWQEAAQMRKELENFVQTLQNDPSNALEQLGFDVDSIAEQHLQQRIEEMQKSPEEREREQLQKELEKLKTEKEKREEEFRQAEMKRMQDQYAVEIENEISDALDQSKTLPKSPYVVKRIADTMLLAHQKGKNDVKVKDVLPVVEKNIRKEIQDMFSTMPEDLVETVVGKENLNRVRKKRVKGAKSAPQKPKVKSTGEAEMQKQQQKQSQAKQKESAKEFFKRLGSF